MIMTFVVAVVVVALLLPTAGNAHAANTQGGQHSLKP